MILVHNRQDTAQDRIDNVHVYVVNGNNKQLCGVISWRKHVHVYPVSCGGKTGSKVRLENKYNYLTLAEVEVFATGGLSKRSAATNYATYYTQHTGSKQLSGVSNLHFYCCLSSTDEIDIYSWLLHLILVTFCNPCIRWRLAIAACRCLNTFSCHLVPSCSRHEASK